MVSRLGTMSVQPWRDEDLTTPGCSQMPGRARVQELSGGRQGSSWTCMGCGGEGRAQGDPNGPRCSHTCAVSRPTRLELRLVCIGQIQKWRPRDAQQRARGLPARRGRSCVDRGRLAMSFLQTAAQAVRQRVGGSSSLPGSFRRACAVLSNDMTRATGRAEATAELTRQKVNGPIPMPSPLGAGPGPVRGTVARAGLCRLPPSRRVPSPGSLFSS